MPSNKFVISPVAVPSASGRICSVPAISLSMTALKAINRARKHRTSWRAASLCISIASNGASCPILPPHRRRCKIMKPIGGKHRMRICCRCSAAIGILSWTASIARAILACCASISSIRLLTVSRCAAPCCPRLTSAFSWMRPSARIKRCLMCPPAFSRPAHRLPMKPGLKC